MNTSKQQPPSPPASKKREMKPRHVKAAAHELSKEAQKILKKHKDRLSTSQGQAIQASLESLERLRNSQDYTKLRDQAEKLDELLHQYAAFARKSLARELGENVIFAVMIALALRSCFYEPFKIPSGSMMPTLRAGDHIFVNKFLYGVQIPFTTTVVGKDLLGSIERGDVIVFRYPHDETVDYIKRVMALPGDTIRVRGSEVAIRRQGEQDFNILEQEVLSEPCVDADGKPETAACQLRRENNGERSYIVRYMGEFANPSLFPARQYRTIEWTVPEDHLLVMGDNRNQSSDSLAWTKTVEAVTAEGLLSIKDLRDLTGESQFEMERPLQNGLDDPHQDHIYYTARRPSPQHFLQLDLWRNPSLGATAVFDSLREKSSEFRPSSLRELISASSLSAEEQTRLLQQAASIQTLFVRKTPEQWTALLKLPNEQLMRFTCGLGSCRDEARLAEHLVRIIGRFERNEGANVRQFLQFELDPNTDQQWTPQRLNTQFIGEQQFASDKKAATPSNRVRLRLWKDTQGAHDWLIDAALRSVGSSLVKATSVGSWPQAWLATTDEQFSYVGHDPALGVTLLLEYGRESAIQEKDVLALAQKLHDRSQQQHFAENSAVQKLLSSEDVQGWQELAIAQEQNKTPEFDQALLEGMSLSDVHRIDVKVWRNPSQGLDAAAQSWANEIGGLTADPSISNNGWFGQTDHRFVSIFSVEKTNVVVQIQCSQELCQKREDIEAFAKRAAEKAQDSSHFIKANAERPSPFVPRGNVKGRADRVWLPLNRFWLPIR